MKMQETTGRRTDAQNAMLWSMLRDISRQVKWPVDGEMVYMSEWDWKDVFTAALKKHQRVAKGLEGGFVMLGEHTSRMTRADVSILIDLILAFSSDKEVVWNERQEL